MKKINIIAFAALAVFLVTSCKDNLVSKTAAKPDIPAAVQVINIDSGDSTVSIAKLTTRQLQVSVLPENAENKTLTYSSQNDGIASVDNNGLITAKTEGETVITIKAASGVQKTINVTVTPEPVSVEDIEVPAVFRKKLHIGGEALNLNDIIKAKPDIATDKGLIYTPDNGNVSIYNGTVTARSEGSVNITVKSRSNPEITKTLTLIVTQKPEIKITEKEYKIGSDDTDSTFKVKTLHDKLDYTVEVASDWLKVDRKDSITSETEDTVHLSAKPNKTVWDRVAYIKFKDANGRYIKGADGKELEVTFTQKKNEHPAVTIKWVDGIGEPTQDEKEKIPVYNGEKKVYWDDNKIFWWNESDTTKWFNNRKLLNLGVTADKNAADSNQCWAKTASNMLHWWFVQNKTYIDRYKRSKSSEEQEKYQDYYKRELYNENKSEEEKKKDKEKEREKSYIANIFRTKAHNNQLGDFTMSGLAWYLYGHSGVTLPTIKEKDPAFEGPALFKDVFSKEDTPIKRETVDGQDSFNKIISTALKSEKAIGIDIWGSKGNKDYAHAITLWGAAFDEEENIIAIYVVDNNFAANRIFPYGIWYKEGKPYLFNYGVNQFVQDRYVGQVTTLDKGEELWKEWFDAHP